VATMARGERPAFFTHDIQRLTLYPLPVSIAANARSIFAATFDAHQP